MVKPISFNTAKRRVAQKAPSVTTTVVDKFVGHINKCFATKESMEQYRCSPAVGHFYQVNTDMQAKPEDCIAIDKAFRDAGWPGVHVVYFKGRLGVSLSFRTWDDNERHRPRYDNKPLYRAA